MFIAAGQSDLALNVLPIMTFIVNHYTLVAISQQTGSKLFNIFSYKMLYYFLKKTL